MLKVQLHDSLTQVEGGGGTQQLQLRTPTLPVTLAHVPHEVLLIMSPAMLVLAELLQVQLRKYALVVAVTLTEVFTHKQV